MQEINSNQKGKMAELRLEIRALEKNWIASKSPEGCRYDYVLDDGENLYRTQVKYCSCEDKRYNGGAACISFRSWEGNDRDVTRTKTKPYTAEEIDVIIVYIEATDKVYWIDKEDFDGKSAMTLRYEPPANNQKKGVKFAKDYEW